jgi:hypothetical protein
MPQDKDFKRLIRERMALTGERYTASRRTLINGRPTTPDKREVRGWLELLALPDQAGPGDTAYKRIASLPTEQRRGCAIQGLRHESWRVRRRCALLLDDLALTNETIIELKQLLEDPHPKVRGAALHTLTCEHCKPEACDIRVRPIAESMLNDPNANVRRQALGGIAGWTGDIADEEALSTLGRVAELDRSAKVRSDANGLLKWHRAKQRGDAERLSLPSDTRARVDRHKGKWVAVSQGSVIAVAQFLGPVHDAIKGMGRTDAVVCWVPFDASAAPEPANI